MSKHTPLYVRSMDLHSHTDGCDETRSDGTSYCEEVYCASGYAQLLAQRDELRAVVERYMGAYPAFRMKPIGAPGSHARTEQSLLMEIEEQALAALKGSQP